MDPPTPLFTIKSTPGAGRGVFASHDLSAGTHILTANDLTVNILFREYRGEVCNNCFAYNRGIKQPVKDATHGLGFCSTQCQDAFTLQNDEVCMTARAAVEKLIRMKPVNVNPQQLDTPESRPAEEDIAVAWMLSDKEGALIRSGRLLSPGKKPSKPSLRAVQRALNTPVSPDAILFLLSAVLAIYRSSLDTDNSTERTTETEIPSILVPLEMESTPYLSPYELFAYNSSYLQLLSILPPILIPFVESRTLQAVKSRETHNSFGIRSLDDGGSEFFGYGVWPSASYFNHACQPNLVRRREGDSWIFKVGKDVKEGEQLVISYLESCWEGEQGGEGGQGGSERECERGHGERMGVKDRRTLLKKTWGFECVCGSCVGEVGGEVGGEER